MGYLWAAGEIATAAGLNAGFPLGVGALTDYTPTLVQSGTVTKTVTRAKYMKMGRWVVGHAVLTVTGSGTANNEVRIGLPVSAASTAGPMVYGVAYVFDTSASGLFKGLCAGDNVDYVTLLDTSTNAATRLGVTGAGFAAGLAAGDVVSINFAYEAAS